MGASARFEGRSDRGSGLGKPSEVLSVAVIHQGGLGDFILSLPALRTLRMHFPQAKFVIMGYPRILELVERRFYAEQIASVDQKGMASFYAQGAVLDPGLSEFFRTFELIVVFGKDAEGPVMSNLRRVCRGRVIQINPFPAWNETLHMTEHLLRELRRHQFVPLEEPPRLFLLRSDQEWGRAYCRKKGLTAEEKSRAIVVHPGSGGKKKVWHLERFLDLVRYLRQRSGSRILVLLGPAEAPEAQKAFEALEWELGPSAPLLVKGLSLIGVASVMEGCRFYIGNDSGITHMAAALGLPTVAIFGPSDPRVWAPRGDHVVVVRKEIPCSPCERDRFVQCQSLDCLKAVEVEDVIEGLETLGFREP